MMYSDFKPKVHRDVNMATLILYLSHARVKNKFVTFGHEDDVTFRITDYHSFIDEIKDMAGLELTYHNPFSEYTIDQLSRLNIVRQRSKTTELWFIISESNLINHIIDLLSERLWENDIGDAFYNEAILMLTEYNQQVIEERIIELL